MLAKICPDCGIWHEMSVWFTDDYVTCPRCRQRRMDGFAAKSALPVGNMSCTDRDEQAIYHASRDPIGSVEEISNECHPNDANVKGLDRA